MALPGFLGDILGIGQAAAGIAGLFFDQPKVPKQAKAAIAAQQGITEQLLNPNDPRFLALVQEEEDRVRRDFAEAIGQYMRSRQHYGSRGFYTVNPERRDESVAHAFTQMNAEARDRARANARAYLLSAAQANNMAVNLINPLYGVEEAGRQQTASGIAGAFQTGRALLNGDPGQTPGLASPTGGSSRPRNSVMIDKSQGLPWLSGGGR